jgi:hypothetical protein
MAGVTGLGAAFVRAENPDALYAWYAKHLGISSPHASFFLPTKRSVPTLPLPSSRVLRSIFRARSRRCSISRWI